jgi:hypothetical protein
MKIRGIYNTRQIFVNGEELLPAESQKVWNHSPGGFSWGYGGSGPAQLALAILLVFLPREQAVSIYQDFKWEVIAALDRDFEIEIDLKKWVDQRYGTEMRVQI